VKTTAACLSTFCFLLRASRRTHGWRALCIGCSRTTQRHSARWFRALLLLHRPPLSQSLPEVLQLCAVHLQFQFLFSKPLGRPHLYCQLVTQISNSTHIPFCNAFLIRVYPILAKAPVEQPSLLADEFARAEKNITVGILPFYKFLKSRIVLKTFSPEPSWERVLINKAFPPPPLSSRRLSWYLPLTSWFNRQRTRMFTPGVWIEPLPC